MRKIFSFVAAALFAGSMMAADLLSIDFTKGQGDWTINDVNKDTLSYVWKQDAQYGMKATAYANKAAHATESWLISPAIDMSGVAQAKLTFAQALNKGEVSSVSVRAKAGSGEWTVLAVAPMPTGTTWDFVDSQADLKDFVGKTNVQIAFVYTSTKQSAATWEIKTVAVSEGQVTPVVAADVVFTSTEFNGQGTSGTGGEVTATKDGVTFTCNKAFGDQYGVRCYKNGVVTITSTSEQIGKIVFEFATVSGKTYDGGGMASEIVVNAKTWSSTMADQARMNKISVFFGEYEKPVVPVVDTIKATVTEALAVGKNIGDGKTTDNYYLIEGYVTALTNNKGEATEDGGWEQYKNQCMWLSDTKDGGTTQETAFFVYQGVASEQVTKGAKVSLVCQIKNYKGMIENATSKPALTILEKGEAPVIPTMDTISVADALKIGYDLLDNAVTTKKYVIEGYVSSIENYYDTAYNNETFWIADEKGSTAATNEAGAFYVYRGKPDTKKEIGVEAHVYVTVYITKYSKECKEPVIENSKTADVTVIEQGKEETIEAVSVAKALEIGNEMAPGQVTPFRYEITGYVSSIDVPYSKEFKNETFWITDSPDEKTSDKTKAFYVYRGKPNDTTEIGLGAKIKITCKIKNYKGTIENDGMGIAFDVLEKGVAPVIDTITTSEAIKIGMDLPDNAYTEDIYVVVGYATKAYDPDSCKTSQNVYMADDPDARGEFYAYSCSPESKIKNGDYFCVLGKLQKYVGSKGTTIEISNAEAKHLEAPKLDTLTVAEVLALDLAEEATTVERFVVIAYVAQITADFEEDLQSFNLSDDATATTGEFACLDAIIAEPGANLHDQVKIIGKIQKLNGKFRMVSGKATVLNGQGIENIVLTEKAQKVMMDGVVYIIRDNKIFNLQGTQVR